MAQQDILRTFAKTVDAELRKQDRIPLFGHAPELNLEEVSSQLKERLQAPGLSFQTDAAGWKNQEKLQDGLGSEVVSIPIAFTPLPSQVLWMMPKEDIARLSSWLLHGHAKSRPVTSDILQEGFYRYLLLQTLDVVQEIEPLKEFSLKIAGDEPIGCESWYCIDVKIKFERRVCWGRLAISKEFLSGWQSHFASIHRLASLSSLAETLEILPTVRVGSISLTESDWKSIHPGDVALIEQLNYDPAKRQGSTYLCLGETPLFYANVHEFKIELIDYARFYEDSMQDSQESQEQPPIAIKDVPLLITIELAQLRMTVAELMKLSPGNFLDLPIRPDQQVTLSVSGRAIGKGEIVSLGETLGVRILETA